MAAKPPAKKRSLYDILGVPRDAMAIDIGLAYKKRLAELERKPDADPQDIALVREAYHILCQTKEREAYDASLITREERDEARTRPAPDIMLDDGGEGEAAAAKKKKTTVIVATAVGMLVVVLLVLSLRPGSHPKPVAEVQPAEEKAPPPPPPPQPKKRNATDILGIAAPAIGGLMAYDPSGKPQSAGSAVLVAPDAIITTCHGLPASATVVARMGVESVPASLEIFDEDLDLCRLRITPVSAKPLVTGPDEPKAGDTVFGAGYHVGAALSVLEGSVRSVRVTPQGRFIDVTFSVMPGASGGALFDVYGRFVGLLTNKGGSTAIAPATLAQMRTRGQAAPPPEKP